MPSANQFKSAENKLVDHVNRFLYKIGASVSGIFKKIVLFGRQRITIMLIPHSERKIFNFKLSVFSLFFFGFVLAGIFTAFFIFMTQYTGVSSMLAEESRDKANTRASLEVLLDEIEKSEKALKHMEKALGKTLEDLGIPHTNREYMDGEGDLSSMFNVNVQEDGSLSGESFLKGLNENLYTYADSIERISEVIGAYDKFLVEMPTIWPVENGVGYISAPFGPAEHPFTHAWYLHKGIDIAYHPAGKKILAAANGRVVERGFQPNGYGNYVLIEHKYGFFTKYAHMQTVYVEEGDKVYQSDIIGTMGTTGMSTGPHLHYEIQIGTEVKDPASYLNIQRSLH